MIKEFITYTHQGATLEGFLAYPSTKSKKLPGVILCHAWRGRDDFVCKKAEFIAKEWGYAAFALDLYGKGILGGTKEENIALMTPFMNDRHFLLSRLEASLQTFQKQPIVDNDNIAIMGFCFGGLCALDLARSGADLAGAISVHGILEAPKDLKRRNISSKILALHGHDDPMVPPDQVLHFEQEMTSAGADWQVHVYGQTMHAFTNPIANDPAFGTVYNPTADRRAWQTINNFLKECFSCP